MSRASRRVSWGLAALLLVLASPAAAPHAARAAAPTVAAVGPIGMTVSDMDRSLGFYTGVLTFTPISDREIAGPEAERLVGVFGARLRVVLLRLGDETLELTEYLTGRGRPIPVDSRSQDRWFQHVAIIVSDMDAAYSRLREHRVRMVSSAPQRLPDWNRAAGGIRAFYFQDPDGHPLEVLQFPEGKGNPKWHRPSDRLFLGIDHTAIVVRDTGASLAFYRDALGLSVAGESENYGTEQEHLNAVFGARLRITALRAAAGPGIEFLEYLAPADGRPIPADARSSDVAHWHTRLWASDLAAAESAARRSGEGLVSPGVVTLPDGALGFTRAFLARDPDGHVVEVAEGPPRE